MKAKQNQISFDLTADNLLEGIQIISPEWRYVYINKAAAIQGRSTPQELTDKTMLEVYPGIESTEMFSILRDCMENRQPRHMVNEFIFPEGPTGWFKLSFEPVNEGVLILSVDITEQKQAEIEIKERERQLSALVTSLTDIVFELDQEGTYLNAWGGGDSKLLQHKEQIIGQRVDQVLAKETAQSFLDAIKLATTKGESSTIEYPLELADEKRWFRAFINPVITQDGSHRTASMLIRDITESMKIRKLRKETLNRYTKVLQNNSVGILFWNVTTGRTVDANDKFLELTGYSRQDIEDKQLTWQELTPDEYLDLTQAEVRNCQIKGQVGPYEKELIRKDGTRQWFAIAGNILDQYTCVEFYVDISERKTIEKSLDESEEKFSTIFKKASFPIMLSTWPEGIIVDINEAFEQKFGYTKQNVVGKTGLELGTRIDKKQRDQTTDALNDVGYVHNFEVSQKVKNGDIHHFLVNLDIVSINGKKFIFHAMQDITSRKLAEKALSETEQLFRQILVQLEDAVWRASLDGKEILEVSPVFEQIYDVSNEALIENPSLWLEMVHPDDYEIAQDSMNTLYEKGVSSAEYRILRPDGTMRWVLDRKSILTDEQNKPYQIGGVVLDITQRKQRQIENDTLLTLANVLREATSRAEMLPMILDNIMKLMHLEGTAFAFINETDNSILIEQAWGAFSESNNMQIPPGKGITNEVISSGKTYVTENLSSDPNLYHPVLLHETSWAACVPLITEEKVIGVLWVCSSSPLHKLDINILEGVADMAATAIDRVTLYDKTFEYAKQITEAYEKNIEGWSAALDLRDHETEGHTIRVTEMTVALARESGIPEDELINVRRGALLHDIGKMGIPDDILLKPGKLNEEEWKIMKTHPTLAYELLSPITFLHDSLDIPYCHHEKWDGSGYPRGLKGEDIPLAARLFAVVDVWDALTNDRPYRKAWSEEKTIAYIQEQSGTHFDPKAVSAFMKVLEQQKKECA